MRANFYVIGSFFVRSRNLFVAVGDITEGDIRPGMSVSVSLGHLQVSTTICGVEVIEVAFRDQDYLGLAFDFESPEDLEFWQALCLNDETLEITA